VPGEPGDALPSRAHPPLLAALLPEDPGVTAPVPPPEAEAAAAVACVAGGTGGPTEAPSMMRVTRERSSRGTTGRAFLGATCGATKRGVDGSGLEAWDHPIGAPEATLPVASSKRDVGSELEAAGGKGGGGKAVIGKQGGAGGRSGGPTPVQPGTWPADRKQINAAGGLGSNTSGEPDGAATGGGAAGGA